LLSDSNDDFSEDLGDFSRGFLVPYRILGIINFAETEKDQRSPVKRVKEPKKTGVQTRDQIQ
jgi:hypothetical protein